MIKKLVNKMFEKKDNIRTVEKISTPDGMVGDNWYQYESEVVKF